MNVRLITHAGETRPLAQWAEITGIPTATIVSRIEKLGWDTARALTTRPDRRFARGGRRRKDAPRPCPELKRHPVKGIAYCRWSEAGHDQWRYFGPWGSPEAKAAYRRFSLEWAAGVPTARAEGSEFHVADLVLAYIAHAEATYRKRGKVTSEVHCCRAALRHLNEVYGEEPAAEFDGKKLRAVREAMITDAEAGWVRKTVNDHIARVVRAFGWAATESLVPAALHSALALVEPLVAGRREDVGESDAVEPVPDAHVAAVLAGSHLHPKPKRRAVLAALVRLQLLTGMRPGELCSLSAGQIDRTREPWRCEFSEYNKMLHKNVRRVVFFGPQARAVLAPLLESVPAGLPLSSLPPWRGKADWSPMTTPRYRNRVRLACLSAGVPVWTPNQLRHNKATEVMDRYEHDQAAAAVIGNSPEVARAVYANRPGEAVAKRIAEATG